MWKYSSTTTNTTTTTNIGVKCRPFFLAVAGFDSHLLHFPTVKHEIHKTKSHDNREIEGHKSLEGWTWSTQDKSQDKVRGKKQYGGNKE